MSTVNVIVAPGNTETVNSLVQEIGLGQIRPSKANPRRRSDEAALAELAANIKAHGVLQPILVRPLTRGGYEIVCGERRWRASKAAGKDSIAARIVDLSDAEALELGVIENIQRENVHELDESLGYKALIKQDPALYTVETLAAKVGRSPKYIYGRLKLAELTPNLQKAFYEGKLTAGHAQEIARLQPKDQDRALLECFPGHVSDVYPYYGQKIQPGVLYPSDYHEAQSAGECPTTTAAVVIEGKQAGRKLYVCTNKKCPTHAGRSYGLTPEEKAERKKQAQEVRVQQEFRKRLLEEVWKRVPDELSRHELDLIAQKYFHVLGHDSQHRIFKFFAWEATKAKGSYGGYADRKSVG